MTGIICSGRRSRTYLEREPWSLRERETQRERKREQVRGCVLHCTTEKSEVKGALIRFDGKQIKKGDKSKRVWLGKWYESGNESMIV